MEDLKNIKNDIPIELEYFDENEKIWCDFKLLGFTIGSLEKGVTVYDFDGLPDKVNGRFLYNNDKNINIWYFKIADKTNLRIKTYKK